MKPGLYVHRRKIGRQSVVVWSAIATALAITVASFVRSKFSASLLSTCFVFILFISTVGGTLIAWLIVVLVFVFDVELRISLMDEVLVDVSVISSIN